MPQAPQEALEPAESPSVPLSSLHLTGSVPEVPPILPLTPAPALHALPNHLSLSPERTHSLRTKIDPAGLS